MRIQASVTPPEHLPIGNSLFINPERVRRLETKYHSEADLAGCSEAFKRRAEHWESGAAVALNFVQIKQGGVPEKSEKFCFGSEKEDCMKGMWWREVYILIRINLRIIGRFFLFEIE